MKKSFTKILTFVLSLLVVVALAACGKKTNNVTPTDAPVNYQAMLDSYLLDIDGKTVDADFVLPKTIKANDKTYEIAWESNNAAVTITAREEDYLAKVTFPDETTVVTLTLHLSNLTKSFTVTVQGIQAASFIKTYQFPQDKATVTKDFALDQETSIQGKKATITWSVPEEYAGYLEISEDGKTCIVHQSSLNPAVKIQATFSYNGQTAQKLYNLTVSKEVSVIESVNDWYYNIGSSITFDGYIVSVGTAYSEQYGNVTLYVVNEDLSAGFYLYRVKADKANGAKLAIGKHVTVTAAVSTNYGGLRESSSTGTVVVNDDKDPLDIETIYKAIDEDVLGNVPAYIYNQSRPVSLTGWEVVEVNAEHAASSPTTVLKIKKNDVTISVVYSKYFEDRYTFSKGAEDTVIKAILDKTATIQVGDFVNVKGILGSYQNAPQISLLSADGIEKGQAEAEGTAHPGLTVKPFVERVLTSIKVLKLEELITSTKEVALTTGDENVTVAYEVLGGSQDIVIDGGHFTITPSVEAKVNVKATFTCGDYSTFIIFTVHSMAMTENEMVDYEASHFEFALLSQAGIQEGYTNHGSTFANVKVEYEGADEASAALVRMVEGNLYLLPVDTQTKIFLKVSFSVGEGTELYEVVVNDVETTIQPSQFVTYERVGAPEADKEYYLGTHSKGSGQLGTWLFADGGATANGYYLTATDDITKAVKFTATQSQTAAGFYTLKTGNKYVKVTHTDNGNNIALVENAEEATPLKLSGEGETMYFAMVDGTNEYALVQNYTNKQVYVAFKDAGHFNNDNYSQYQLLVVTEDKTDTQGRADAVAQAITLPKTTIKNLELPTSSNVYSDVFITWALKEAVEGQTLENNVLTITRGETNVDVVLVATATCGVKTATKEITVTVEANAKVVDLVTLVTAALAAEDNATLAGQYEVTGYVKAVTGAWSDSFGNMTVTISDASGLEVSLYRTTTQMTVGDVVTVVGYVQKYVKNDVTTIQFKQGHTVKSHTEATLITPTELYEMFKDGNATDEQKNTVFVVVAPVTKVVNGISGTYTTGNYFVSDATAAVEAYKLGQADKGTDALLKIKEGTVIAFYGKATVFGTTVETSPSTLIGIYEPEKPTYTITNLEDIDATGTTEGLYVSGVIELITEGEGGTLSGIMSQTVNGVSKYVGFTLPAGTKAAPGSKIVMKLEFAVDGEYGIAVHAAEVVSCLYPSTVVFGKVTEATLADLTTTGYTKVVVNDVTVANDSFQVSNTVTGQLFKDANFTIAADLEDGAYNITGYAIPADDSTVNFLLISWEKALPKQILKSTVTSGTDAAAATTAGTLNEALNLDPTKFTATYDKNGASNEMAIRTDGIRMYATKSSTNGNKLTVTAAEGITIVSIKIEFDSDSYAATAQIIVGDQVITGVGGVYEINATSFTIFNNNENVTSNTQVRFQSISIYYTVAE